MGLSIGVKSKSEKRWGGQAMEVRDGRRGRLLLRKLGAYGHMHRVGIGCERGRWKLPTPLQFVVGARECDDTGMGVKVVERESKGGSKCWT